MVKKAVNMLNIVERTIIMLETWSKGGKYRGFFSAAIYHAPSPINRLNKKYDGA